MFKKKNNNVKNTNPIKICMLGFDLDYSHYTNNNSFHTSQSEKNKNNVQNTFYNASSPNTNYLNELIEKNEFKSIFGDYNYKVFMESNKNVYGVRHYEIGFELQNKKIDIEDIVFKFDSNIFIKFYINNINNNLFIDIFLGNMRIPIILNLYLKRIYLDNYMMSRKYDDIYFGKGNKSQDKKLIDIAILRRKIFMEKFITFFIFLYTETHPLHSMFQNFIKNKKSIERSDFQDLKKNLRDLFTQHIKIENNNNSRSQKITITIIEKNSFFSYDNNSSFIDIPIHPTIFNKLVDNGLIDESKFSNYISNNKI